MMDVILRKHADDNEMLEIIEIRKGKKLLYGVVHCDFVADDLYIKTALEGLDEVKVKIELSA